MIPVLFDTNTYGKIIFDPESQRVIDMILASQIHVLNFSLIRDELRNTAKRKVYRSKSVLPVLLSAYDQLAARRLIAVSTSIKQLANAYYTEYRSLGGNVTKKQIMNDCRILACATLHDAQLIVSSDSSMKESAMLITARNRVNNIYLPRIFTYTRLKVVLKRVIDLSSD